MMKIKQIGDVEVKGYSINYNEFEIQMSVVMNGKIYKQQTISTEELWDDNRFIKSIVHNFLKNVALQEYDVEFFEELNVQQKNFLPKLESFVIGEEMEEEAKFIQDIQMNGGYTKKERDILNILKEKYKKEHEKLDV